MRTRGSIWSTLTIALAVIAAVAIASPALGGPSLRSLVKKEVTKQIAGKTGPQGPGGPSGTNGTQGPGALRLTFSQPETDNTVREIGTINEMTVSASLDDDEWRNMVGRLAVPPVG